MLSVIVVNVWRGFPFTTIVILAGLTAIPDEILERARLEGANAFQRFVHIISPMVRPILMVSLLFSVIFSFTDFNTIWIITKGGPLRSDAGALDLRLPARRQRRIPRQGRGDLALHVSDHGGHGRSSCSSSSGGEA